VAVVVLWFVGARVALRAAGPLARQVAGGRYLLSPPFDAVCPIAA
jgi:hypothetical protein